MQEPLAESQVDEAHHVGVFPDHEDGAVSASVSVKSSRSIDAPLGRPRHLHQSGTRRLYDDVVRDPVAGAPSPASPGPAAARQAGVARTASASLAAEVRRGQRGVLDRKQFRAPDGARCPEVRRRGARRCFARAKGEA